MKPDSRWIWRTIGGMTLVFTAFSVLLWKIGLFNFAGTEASAKIVASSVALIGGFIGSLVTVVGIFLKHSIDQRNADLKQQAENRLSMESERNNNLKEEGEKRLKLEAAIQAVKLLSTSSGEEVPASQRAGVLFALTFLELPELALKMLTQMIPNDLIDPGTACWLINYILESDNVPLREEAVMILNNYPDKFLVDRGQCEIPRSVFEDWNTKLPEIVRTKGTLAILRILAARQYSDWKIGVLTTFVVTLNYIYENEPIEKLKNGVGLCLEKIMRVYPESTILHASYGDVCIGDVKAKLSKLVKDPNIITYDSFLEVSSILEQWQKSEPNGSPRP